MLCGVSALILSIVLLNFGLLHMGIRYLLCFVFAYVLFLLLVRLWASRRDLSDLDPGLEVPLPDSSSAPAEAAAGGGGRFGGGGASGSWAEEQGPAPVSRGGLDLGSPSHGPDLPSAEVPDLDEAFVLVVPILILAGAVGAAGYIVAGAPILLAEVVLDVAIAAGAYRRMRRLQPRHWAVGAFRRTWKPALGAAVVIGTLGFWLQVSAPDSHTIGAALSEIVAAA